MTVTLTVRLFVSNFEEHDESITKFIANDVSLETGIFFNSNVSSEAKSRTVWFVKLLLTATLQSNPLNNLSCPLPASIWVTSP